MTDNSDRRSVKSPTSLNARETYGGSASLTQATRSGDTDLPTNSLNAVSGSGLDNYLNTLDAQRTSGVSANSSSLLTPGGTGQKNQVTLYSARGRVGEQTVAHR